MQVDSHRILDSYHKMSFKLDERDIFPPSDYRYYVSGINIKYPLTFGQAYYSQFMESYNNSSALVHIFDDD